MAQGRMCVDIGCHGPWDARAPTGLTEGTLTLPRSRAVLDARGVELSSDERLEVRFDRRHRLQLPGGTDTRVRRGVLETAEPVYLDLPDGASLTLARPRRVRGYDRRSTGCARLAKLGETDGGSGTASR